MPSVRRLQHVTLVGLLVLIDILTINAALILSYRRFAEELRQIFEPPTPAGAVRALIIFNLVFAASFWLSGLYRLKRGSSRIDEIYGIFRAVSIAVVFGIAINTTFQFVGVTNQVVVTAWLLALGFASVLRLSYRTLLGWLRSHGVDNRRLVIVGADSVGQFVWRQLQRSPRLGYKAVGFLSDTRPVGEIVDGLPVLGSRADLPKIVRCEGIDEVIIALNNISYPEVLSLVALIDDRHVGIKIYPDAFQIITSNEVSVGDLSGLPLISLRTVPLDHSLNRAVKRAMDLVIASVILVLSSPLLLLLAVLIRLESPGPVFFVQERVGLDGRPFKILKLRSMRADAEEHARWTRPDDDRRTRLGSLIRRFSLDELPQFINVLWGDMSIVGPRPEQPSFVEEFRQRIPSYMRRHREKAGITGWAQINGLRGDTSIEERTRYDLYYVENWSPFFDLKIMLRTVIIMLRGEAY